MIEKSVEINGSKIHYLEEGDSENILLLLHGLGASAERWEYVIPIFASLVKPIFFPWSDHDKTNFCLVKPMFSRK